VDLSIAGADRLGGTAGAEIMIGFSARGGDPLAIKIVDYE
jgi:hypothetical protein